MGGDMDGLSTRKVDPLTPDAEDENGIVAPGPKNEVTVPEAAPPVRKTPSLGMPLGDAARSRKQTLMSPIPSILAASMGDVVEPPPEEGSLPAGLRADAVADEDDLDYLVEVD